MAASKLQAKLVSGRAARAQPITRVTAVTFAQGGSLQEFAADGDRFPTTILNLMSKPTASVTSADIAVLMAIAPAGHRRHVRGHP